MFKYRFSYLLEEWQLNWLPSTPKLKQRSWDLLRLKCIMDPAEHLTLPLQGLFIPCRRALMSNDHDLQAFPRAAQATNICCAISATTPPTLPGSEWAQYLLDYTQSSSAQWLNTPANWFSVHADGLHLSVIIFIYYFHYYAQSQLYTLINPAIYTSITLADGCINCFLLVQFSAAVSGNTQSKSYMLSINQVCL